MFRFAGDVKVIVSTDAIDFGLCGVEQVQQLQAQLSPGN